MKEPFISVLISEEKLNERIAQLGEQISKDYEGKEVKLICILKGSIIFTCELAKRITVPVKFDFMQVSSCGSGTSSSGQIKIKKDLDESIEGEHVIVIEDIIDSGNTLARLMPMLEERKPADICIGNQKQLRIFNAAVNVTFGSEIHHIIKTILSKKTVYHITAANVSFDKDAAFVVDVFGNRS